MVPSRVKAPWGGGGGGKGRHRRAGQGLGKTTRCREDVPHCAAKPYQGCSANSIIHRIHTYLSDQMSFTLIMSSVTHTNQHNMCLVSHHAPVHC